MEVDSGSQGADTDDSEFVEVDPTGRYGRYKEILGRGAFKTVYKAFDEVDGIEVAWNQVNVQNFLGRPDDLERLYSEVDLLKSLKHKNVIKFFTSWVDPRTKNVNFITEIFTSGTLRQYRKKHKNVDIKAVKNWAKQILRGLLYLHSHDPPIIHRDIKCDNIFVNGNQGEVKIGDLGLATILRQAQAAHSVIGTPEFMAPELYDENYNELVDIYAFGMCLLELVTFEYPYSECHNAAQIFRKVTSGIKPAALEKVKDQEVKNFIEKCLATASKRLPARELLKDPFLQCEADREEIPKPSPTVNVIIDIEESTKRKEKEAEGQSRSPRDNDDNNRKPSRNPYSEYKDEMQKSKDFKVKGKLRQEDIFLRLRISEQGHVRNIHFAFDLEADTALIVASEMITELDLSDQDVATIADMIDAEILSLVPDWRPGASFEMDEADESEPIAETEAVCEPEVTSPPAMPSTTSTHGEGMMFGRFEEVSMGSSSTDNDSYAQQAANFSQFSDVTSASPACKQDMVVKWIQSTSGTYHELENSQQSIVTNQDMVLVSEEQMVNQDMDVNQDMLLLSEEQMVSQDMDEQVVNQDMVVVSDENHIKAEEGINPSLAELRTSTVEDPISEVISVLSGPKLDDSFDSTSIVGNQRASVTSELCEISVNRMHSMVEMPATPPQGTDLGTGLHRLSTKAPESSDSLLKKKKLQRSIAELEARTLEELLKGSGYIAGFARQASGL